MTAPIAPSAVRFIRLGQGGAWADAAIAAGEVVFGDADMPASLTATGDWEGVKRYWIDRGKAKKAVSFTRESREFHELPETCLWITFHAGLLWWAFAERAVAFREVRPDARVRKTLGPWRSTDLAGGELRKSELSSWLTQTGSYQQSICQVTAESYLIRRINGDLDPDLRDAEVLEGQLADVVLRLISRLHWRDFELLADRLAEAVGWRRSSTVGGSQAAVDFIADIPALGVRGYFQVKASAGQRELNGFVAAMTAVTEADRLIFVCHKPRGRLIVGDNDNLEIWTGKDLALRAIRAGLLPWIIERTQ